MPTTEPDPETVGIGLVEPAELTGVSSPGNTQAPEPIAEPLPFTKPAPADPLYMMVRAHEKIPTRRVMTPRGYGKLGQVFYTRAGVPLDPAPGGVPFFAPSVLAAPPGPLPNTQRAIPAPGT